ncbi:hypothetical protein [Halopelagius longus]|uniref:HIT zinc finger n=1 Tax=Halopelagius longus TaxID=1236180 RepID=A0A1H0YGF8_9EURY|nr:hypothetical protein [Halopelagius longus]RDI72475.1 hypothetical protein DWB78_12525 [Halopelagius longus]SDQ14232.1 hypothetical protein SAMN05216278_0620 [Halopelagius longus]
MSRSSLCEICESRPATNVCPRCGAQVCDQDFDSEHRMCESCLSSVQGEDDVSPGYDDGPGGGVSD